MIKVNGIAGVFLYANDPKKLAEWYTLHSGSPIQKAIISSYTSQSRRAISAS